MAVECRCFSSLGVEQMSSDGPPPFRQGWRSNVAAILLRTTPVSQRAEPSPLWLEAFTKRRIMRGTTGISRVACEKAKRGYASPVPFSHGATARRTRAVQVGGPAVPERGIGPGGVSRCCRMPATWKWQPTRQSSRLRGEGDLRRPWPLRCRHGEDRPTGAGKPGLERSRKDRRFQPPGVKDVASYGWPPYKAGVAHVGGSPGGSRF